MFSVFVFIFIFIPCRLYTIPAAEGRKSACDRTSRSGGGKSACERRSGDGGGKYVASGSVVIGGYVMYMMSASMMPSQSMSIGS